MSILAGRNTKVLVQGMTGTQASFHTKRSLDYGTDIVAGVTPGKGGTVHLGLPVFDTVKEAVAETGATASLMFVPARMVKSAIAETAEAGLELAVCISDNVPVRDMLEVRNILKSSRTRLIGPNTPGLITPGEARLGTFPENIHTPGRIGIVSRSSTLTYEAVLETRRVGFGQSTVVGLGDDTVIGMNFVDVLREFMADEATEATVSASTERTPAFFSAAAHSFKVEPVVRTSSISTTLLPASLSGCGTEKAFFTFLTRSKPENSTCGRVFL